MEEEPYKNALQNLSKSKSNGKIILDLHLKYGENHIKSWIYWTFTSMYITVILKTYYGYKNIASILSFDFWLS